LGKTPIRIRAALPDNAANVVEKTFYRSRDLKHYSDLIEPAAKWVSMASYPISNCGMSDLKILVPLDNEGYGNRVHRGFEATV